MVPHHNVGGISPIMALLLLRAVAIRARAGEKPVRPLKCRPGQRYGILEALPCARHRKGKILRAGSGRPVTVSFARPQAKEEG